MNILVAGATGKTGLRLIEELKSNGHSPIALVRESSDTSALASDVTLRHGDLTDLKDDVCAAFKVIGRQPALAGVHPASGHFRTC